MPLAHRGIKTVLCNSDPLTKDRGLEGQRSKVAVGSVKPRPASRSCALCSSRRETASSRLRNTRGSRPRRSASYLGRGQGDAGSPSDMEAPARRSLQSKATSSIGVGACV